MSPDADTTRVIISDLHLGKNDDFDIFKADGKEDAFEAFLAHCGKLAGPVELIINGDFVDFLQLKPWDIYKASGKVSIQKQALSKATEIVQESARIFKTLGDFLANPKTRIVVLLGNHDVELAYDDVWAVIQKAILGASGDKDRLRFINRATQYNFRVGGVLVHVEHGNIGDPWNEIVYKELFEAAETNSEFQFPPGTRFVYQVMNEYKEKLYFVDLLKPEVPAVPLLLVRLEPFQSVMKLPQTSLNFMRTLKQDFIGRVRKKAHGGSFAVKERDEPSPEDHIAEMARLYFEEVDRDADHLEAFLKDDGSLQDEGPSAPSLGPGWLERIKGAFGDAILKRLGRPAHLGDISFYQANHDGRDVELAQERVKGDIQVVVFGHTHSALKREFSDKAVYINSGTWANLIELPTEAKDFPAWLEQIANNQFKRTSFPTYITLVPDNGAAKASLNHWSDKGEQVLWSKNITASK
jgi:UDP-2,3-diacylglucosamine pyrophosphatase LpxH